MKAVLLMWALEFAMLMAAAALIMLLVGGVGYGRVLSLLIAAKIVYEAVTGRWLDQR